LNDKQFEELAVDLESDQVGVEIPSRAQ